MRLAGHLRTCPRLARRLGTATAGLATALAMATGALPGTGTTAAHAIDRTQSQDNLRSGWDSIEPGMTAGVVDGQVSGSTFAAIPGFPVTVSGLVYGQPLVIPEGSIPLVIVGTETDWVYGINGRTGKILWSTSIGKPYTTHLSNCGIFPGVTSAPVFDAATNTVYFLAHVTISGNPAYQLVGVNPVTGAASVVATIGGSPANDPSITFDASHQLQRVGLLLLNGWVYTAFASFCDLAPYDGYITGVNVTTGRQTLWTDESGLTDNQAGIWQSGGGLVSDGAGRIFFTSGNGVSPAPGKGSQPPGQLAESLVRLAVNSNGSLTAKDFFSPANAPQLDAVDRDWGAGGPVGLPFGTSTYPALMVQAGKDGRVFLLNRNNLGGRMQGPGGTDAALAQAGPYGGQFGHPAAFGNTTLTPGATHANDYLYYVGKNDYLRVFRVGADSSGKPALSLIATSAAKFGYTSGSPIVTSSGNIPASAVVWDVGTTGVGGPGTLTGYPATPASPGWPEGCTTGCVLNPIFSASTGTSVNFTTPASSGNAVYAGAANQVYGFGTANDIVARAGIRPSFQASVGSATVKPVSVTATRTVTVTGVSAHATSSDSSATAATPTAAQFTAETGHVTLNGGSSPVTFPVTLHKGDRLTAPVKFTPAGPGGVTGTLTFKTTSAKLPPVSVPLSGRGTQPGLYTASSSVQFALVGNLGQFESWIAAGMSVPQQITFTNGGAAPTTITAVSRPPAPFSVTGVPKPGTVLQPGQSFVAVVRFTPVTGNVTYNDTLTVATSDGPPASVGLVSQSLPATGLFHASPSSVKLGAIPVGKQATVTIRVTNTGNEPATMVGASRLRAPFRARYVVTPQLPLNPGYDLTLPVTFTPVKKGSFTASYTITWTDVLGTHTLTIPVSATGT